MDKTSISVPEMQRLLGMKKVEAYWLVKQGRFKVILVGGRMRIMLDSFEEWYDRQFHYRKVNGPEPGQLLPASWSVAEVAGLLRLNPSSIYTLIKDHAPFGTFKVDGQTRILKESFETWYQSQLHYKKQEDAAPQELLDATLSVSDIARLLDIHRNSVYDMVNKLHLFATVKANDQIRIYKDSFEAWYQGQSHYKTLEDAVPRELLDVTLSVGEIAGLLGIHRSSVKHMVKKRKLFAAITVNGKIRIYKDSFEAWRKTQPCREIAAG